MHASIAHCDSAGTWRVVEHQPLSRPRSHGLVDAGIRHANFPNFFALLLSCLSTRHLWLKEGGKTAFTKVCPGAALDPSHFPLWPPLYLGPALLLCLLLHCSHAYQKVVYGVSITLCASSCPFSPRPLLPPRRPPAESQAAASISGAASNVHNRPKDIPWPPNSQPHLHRPRADCNETSPAPIPAGPLVHLLQNLRSSSPPTNASRHRNCGSNTCRPLRTRRQATSTPNNNDNHTKTCPPVRQRPLRFSPRQIAHPPLSATPWLRPRHPPP